MRNQSLNVITCVAVGCCLLAGIWAINSRMSNRRGNADDLPDGWEIVSPSTVANCVEIVNADAVERLQALKSAGILTFTTDPKGNLLTVTVTDVDALLNMTRDSQFADRLEALESAIVKVESRGGT